MNRSIPLLTLTALLAASFQVAAQSYRWTDPATGRTVFSNQAPPANVKPKVNPDLPEVAAAQAELPFALREPTKNFPVALYTSGNCKEICDNARRLLEVRGTPYTEHEIDAQQGLDELRQVSGAETIPTLMVGAQAARGFDARTWNNVLDLAGYPQRPPAGYKPVPAKAAAATAPPPAAPAAQ